MFRHKSIILSGNNNKFNDFFLMTYFKKAGNITVVQDYISSEFRGGDILFHYVPNELEKVHNFFAKDEEDYISKIVLDKSIKNYVKKVVFLSDGITPIENDKMIKNLMLRYAGQRSKTQFLYVMIKDCENMQEMVDFSIFALKNGKSGDIFVKKVHQRMTFANRIKSLVKKETKTQANRKSFYSSLEMSRAVDHGNYIKIPMESRVLEEV